MLLLLCLSQLNYNTHQLNIGKLYLNRLIYQLIIFQIDIGKEYILSHISFINHILWTLITKTEFIFYMKEMAQLAKNK